MILNVSKTCPAIWKILFIVLIELCNVNGIFQQKLVPEPPPPPPNPLPSPIFFRNLATIPVT